MSAFQIYDMLIDEALSSKLSDSIVTKVVLGINWTVVEITSSNDGASTYAGICFSPVNISRTLPWSGSLVGRSTKELIPWIKHWQPAEACVGCAVINALINSQYGGLHKSLLPKSDGAANTQVFSHFREQLLNKNVAVIGHYPNLDPFPECNQWLTIERNPKASEYPDPAAYFLLPESDWVFITASSISNKTLPALLEASASAQVVLMGPSLPWANAWQQFGVNYLAGVEILDGKQLFQIAAEAGGTRLFEGACRYRIVGLS